MYTGKKSVRKRYSRLRRKVVSFSRNVAGGSVRRDVRPVEPSVYDPPDIGDYPDDDDYSTRRRLTDDAYRRAMSGERESGVRYSFSYGYY